MRMLKHVTRFHTKFGLEYNGQPRAVKAEMAGFRHKFGREELDEYLLHNDLALQAIERGDRESYEEELNHVLDALVDQMYVLMGTIYLHGMGKVFRRAWNRVQRANMSKVRATSAEQSKRGSTLDVVKPEGWVAPCHRDLVSVNEAP